MAIIAVIIVVKVLFVVSRQMAAGPALEPRAESTQSALPLAETTGQPAAPTSGFERLDLEGGIQVDVPIQWEPLPDEITTAIRTSANAMIANEGISGSSSGTRLLVAYTSRPTTTYAALRVKETRPSPISPSELLAATDEEIAAVAPVLIQQMSSAMAKQGQDLQPGATTTRELVSGHPALVFRYRRLDGAGGTVSVEQIKIFTPAREVLMTLSYRESESLLWRPVIQNIRQSIKVAREG